MMSEIIHFYHTNDFHSHFENWPRIVEFLKERRLLHQEMGDEAIILDIGDHVDRWHPFSEGTLGKGNVRYYFCNYLIDRYVEKRSVEIMMSFGIVDDDAVSRLMLQKIIEKGGLGEVVGTAGSGSEGEKVLLETTPDVVVIDLFMPDQDGIETIIRLKEQGYQGSM